MNVEISILVAICVWQINWSAHGLKLSLSNFTIKSVPAFPASSSTSNPLKNTLSSPKAETTLQASCKCNNAAKITNIVSQSEGICNANQQRKRIVNNVPSTLPTLSSVNRVSSQNSYINTLKETESLNLGSSAFDPLSFSSLLSSPINDLETKNNNLLSAIQNSLNVQNNNFISPSSFPSVQSNNGIQSLPNEGLLPSNALNKNLVISGQNTGISQSSNNNNNVKTSMQSELLESNLLSNLLSNSQTVPNVKGLSYSLETANNNLLSGKEKSSNAQNNNIIASPSFTSSQSGLNSEYLKNTGAVISNSLNTNLFSSNQKLGSLKSNSVGHNILTSPDESSLSNFLSNLYNIDGLPNTPKSQTVESIKANAVNCNLQSTPQNIGSSIFTINSNIQDPKNDNKYKATNSQSNNLIQTTHTVKPQITNINGNNLISTKNTMQQTNAQNNDKNSLQSNILNNIQNLQNLQFSSIDASSSKLPVNPTLTFSPNLASNNVPQVLPLNQAKSDLKSLTSNFESNNNIINPPYSSTNSYNNDLQNYLKEINLLSSINPSADLAKSIVQNSVKSSPLLIDEFLKKNALSEVLSENPLVTTKPYNKFSVTTQTDTPTVIAPFDLVSNYNKNVLLQQLSNNIYESDVINNNRQLQNKQKKSGSPNISQKNKAQYLSTEKNILSQNLLSSKLNKVNTIPDSLITEALSSQNILFGINQNILDTVANYASNKDDSSNIGTNLYNNLMNKLQKPKPINNNNEINDKNQLNLSTNKNVMSESSISNNDQNKDYFNSILNTQISSADEAKVLSKINNLPRIPSIPPAYFNSLFNNNIKNPNTAYLESTTSKTSPSPQKSDFLLPDNLATLVPSNLSNTIKLPQANYFVPFSNLINANDISSQSTSLSSEKSNKICPDLSALNVLAQTKINSSYPEVFPTNNVIHSTLHQSMNPVRDLSSVNKNLGPTQNNIINYNLNRNTVKNNILSNLLNLNGISLPENQINPISYLPTPEVTPSLDSINKLKLLENFTTEKISPKYLAYLNLMSKLSNQKNLDLSSLNLATQIPAFSNLAEETGSYLNFNPFLPSSSVPNSLNIDTSLNTLSLSNTEFETLSNGQEIVSTSVETATESSLMNPYAFPPISNLPNVHASNYLSLPLALLYNKISPSNLVVPKIENLISTSDLTKSITNLGNEIARQYIDNLRAKKSNLAYSPPAYNPILPLLNVVSEKVVPNENISPRPPITDSTQYFNNLASQPSILPYFKESLKEIEQTNQFPYSSLPQTNIQTEITQRPILPNFYPTEFSVYSPSVLPTPNINYPVYPSYIPAPPMTFPPIPPLFPPMPPIIETPILKMGSNGQDVRRWIEVLLIAELLNNDCNNIGALEALLALLLAT